ncbi:MAG: O-antigen ligase family protein [Gammaproteobacteria bacterium]|nr:O-antigen ligase family protein [Gammaproteobacteria bacterium]
MPRYFLIGVFACCGLISWAWLQKQSPTPIVWHRGLGLIILFIAYASISVSWSGDPHNSLIEITQLVAMGLLAFLAAQYLDNNSLLNTIKFIILGATAAALLGILQYFFFNPLGFMQLAAPASTFTNKNFAALYFDLVLPLTLIYVVIQDTTKKQWLYGLFYCICLTFVICTHTRGSWLGLSAALLLAIILVTLDKPLRDIMRSRLATALKPIIIFSLLAGLIPQLGTGVMEGDKPLERLGSANIRINAYFNALNLIKDKPILGTGFGDFRQAFRPYMFSWPGHEINEATEDLTLERLHNDLMQIFVELGLPGGILFCIIAITALRSAYRLLKNESDPSAKLMQLGILLALVASLAHAAVDFPLRKPSSAVLFWVLMGIILGLHARSNNFNSKPLSSTMYSILMVFSSVFLVFNIYFYSTYFVGSRNLLIAENSLSKKDCPAAMAAIDKDMGSFGFDFASKTLQIIIYSFCPAEFNRTFFVIEKALAYDPTNARALLTHGYLMLQLKDFSSSERDFKAVTHIIPNRASGFAGLARVAYDKREYASAKIYINQALSKEPANKDLIKLQQLILSP